MSTTQTTEYAVYRGTVEEPYSGDVDHVKWWEAKKLVTNPPDDVTAIERVTRYWSVVGENGSLEDQKIETLFERKEIK